MCIYNIFINSRENRTKCVEVNIFTVLWYMQKSSGKRRTSVFCENNFNLQNKCFFFDNNKDAKLIKVSFPILTSFLKRKGWRGNNKFISKLKLNFVLFTSIKCHEYRIS